MYIFKFDNISKMYAQLRIKMQFPKAKQLEHYVFFESYHNLVTPCPWRIKIPLINVRQVPRPFLSKNVRGHIDDD
jgi:hypothetical protein